MPMKGQSEATEWLETPRRERGVASSVPRRDHGPRESRSRDDAGVFVADPIDDDGVDDLFAEFGDVAGVVI